MPSREIGGLWRVFLLFNGTAFPISFPSLFFFLFFFFFFLVSFFVSSLVLVAILCLRGSTILSSD